MKTILLLLVATLQGCAVIAAYPVTTASLAVWGVTGKSTTDHAVSFMTEQDCESFRLLKGDDYCQNLPAVQYAEVVDSQGKVELASWKNKNHF